MATSLISLTVVDVGQGQCTFVEIYNDEDPAELVHTLLIDCGSDKESDDTPTNLEYIRSKVGEMKDPAFDCIVFSHSDKDHISLTKQLLEGFTTKPKVKKVWYGGAYDLYKKGKVTKSNPYPNILDWLKKNKYCEKKDISTPGSNFSNYDKATAKYTGNLWENTDADVKLYCLAANVLKAEPDWTKHDENVKGTTAEAKNRVSIICALYFDGTSYTMCGDATNMTMAAMNNLFTGTAVFNNNEMVTLPHHGSSATGYKIKKGETPRSESRKVVETFATLLSSRIITVSAFEKHRHPSLMLMNSFPPTINEPFLKDARLKDTNAHRVNCYVDIDLTVYQKPDPKQKKRKRNGTTLTRDQAYTFDTRSVTFTTRYTGGTGGYSYQIGGTEVKDSLGVEEDGDGDVYIINPHACWQFDKSPGTGPLAGGYPNLKLPLKIFTSGADSIKPGTMGRIGIWEVDDWKKNKVKKEPSPVKTRKKANQNFAQEPVSATPKLKGQLKQFP